MNKTILHVFSGQLKKDLGSSSYGIWMYLNFASKITWIVILKNIGHCVENRRLFHCLTYSLKHLAKCFGLVFLMCF